MVLRELVRCAVKERTIHQADKRTEIGNRDDAGTTTQ